MAAAVADQSCSLQLARGFGDAFTAHTQQAGNQLLCHDQIAGGHAVQRHQQPSTQLLVDAVVSVAGGCLAYLRGQRLRIAQKQVLQPAAKVEFLLQHAPLQPIGMPGRLHDSCAGRGVAAHEQRNADNAFMAHTRHFRRGAGFGDVMQGDDAGGREIGVAHLHARLVEAFAQRQGHQLQMRGKTFEFRRRQGGKQVVLVRVMHATDQEDPRRCAYAPAVTSTPMPR